MLPHFSHMIEKVELYSTQDWEEQMAGADHTEI